MALSSWSIKEEMISSHITSYVLKAALRDKVLLSFFVLFLVTTSLSIFMGGGAVNEKDQFALVFAAGALRAVAVIGLILFIVFFIRRSHESRDIEFILSRPIGRLQFTLSYLSAFLLIALMSTLIVSACLWGIGNAATTQNITIWTASLFMELCLMSAAAFFFSMALSSAAISAFATFAFYVLGRMMGQILGIIDGNIVENAYTPVLEAIMQLISMVMPRFDLMAQSSWLLYSDLGDNDLWSLAMHATAYMFLLVSALYVDLRRKQF